MCSGYNRLALWKNRIQAMIAFLSDGALALDPQMHTKSLLMVPNYSVKSGVRMRRVHLKARAGPASTLCR